MVKACEFCAAPKGASDVAAFGMRVCAPCLEGMTISGYRLGADWKLPRERLEGLRHTTKSFWAILTKTQASEKGEPFCSASVGGLDPSAPPRERFAQTNWTRWRSHCPSTAGA